MFKWLKKEFLLQNSVAVWHPKNVSKYTNIYHYKYEAIYTAFGTSTLFIGQDQISQAK